MPYLMFSPMENNLLHLQLINTSTNQRHSSFFIDSTVIFCYCFQHPDIYTGGLLSSCKFSIPAIIEPVSGKDHLTPAVKYPEIIYLPDPYRYGNKLIVFSIIIRCKTCGNIYIRAFVYLYSYKAFTFASGNGRCNNFIGHIITNGAQGNNRIGDIGVT